MGADQSSGVAIQLGTNQDGTTAKHCEATTKARSLNLTSSSHGMAIKEVDVLIIGSGPLGCTFARKLHEKGRSIFMIDAGAKLSETPGWHLKNSYLYQRNINEFTGVIQGHLHTISVPVDKNATPYLDPGAYKVDLDKYKGFVANNENPEQNPYDNLPAASATYAVGGMATHWTACTPREHPTIERSQLFTDQEWDEMYKEAETILKTNQNMFDDTKIDQPGGGVLGEDMLKALKKGDRFELQEMWQCVKLIYRDSGRGIQKVGYAEVRDLLSKNSYYICANTYVIAAGAVLTPQILFNSGIRPTALGHYLCYQPKAYCQVILLQSIVDSIMEHPKWRKMVEEYRETHPDDPIPIPPTDPLPQCWIPVSEGRPWHCQVHRDAFAYGKVPPNIDSRLVVELRWFAKMEPRFENCVEFSTKDDNKDTFGLPQPIFKVKLSKEEGATAHLMMEDMLVAAKNLGGFLPGSEPTFQKPGSALHITGTCRMGTSQEDSVVDIHSKVWGYDNLYLGTCGVIPTGTACNPTLTAMAIAIKACQGIPGKPDS
ncbi:uncharacterized protein [Montipora capricornis]|uniref:uncharacterized protein n=1 Tax=Montipora capricornis TaxID=246305 RepID=UPI0035F1B4AD